MGEGDIDPAGNGWHLDKRVPIVMIFSFVGVIIVQSGTALWWMSDLKHSVANNTISIVELKDRQKTGDGENRSVREQMIRLEGAIQATNRLLEEIKRQQREDRAERRRQQRNQFRQ